MGYPYPQNGPVDGDEPTYSPSVAAFGLLGASKVTQGTRRIYVDDTDGGLLVHVVGSDSVDTLLHSGSTGPIADGVTTTISTFTAMGSVVIHKVVVSGEAAADFTLRKNLVNIAIKRTNLDLDAEFTFNDGLQMSLGDTLDVRVLHYSVGKLRDFNMFVHGV